MPCRRPPADRAPQLLDGQSAPLVGLFVQERLQLVHVLPRARCQTLPHLSRQVLALRPTERGLEPFKASKVVTDVTEALVMDIGLGAGLVGVKVCAVNEVWSGLKFVRRVRDRAT